jgi:hypothetical protein
MNSCWCLWSIPLYDRPHNRPYSLRCDLTIPYFRFPPFRCLFCWYFFWWFSWPQLTAALHVGSQVSCESFHSFLLCFNNLFNPGRSWLFISESVTLLVDSLHVEAIEAVKSRRFSGSFLRVISILGDIKWDRVRFVNFSSGSQVISLNVIQCAE